MDHYRRSQFSDLYNRLNQEVRFLQIIAGPRQCGKTTLIQQVIGSIDNRPCYYVACDDPNSFDAGTITEFGSSTPEFTVPTGFTWTDTLVKERLVSFWNYAREVADRSDNGAIWVFDEIQRIPDWATIVKGLWDADRMHNRQLHVVLLGSSPWQLLEGRGEGLTGRFELIRLPHWSFEEMQGAFEFNLKQFIFFGGYPGSATYLDSEIDWRRYIRESILESHLERDILSMKQVDKPALMKRLVEICSTYSGQILSYNKMLGQLMDAGNAATLADYLDRLDSAWLISGLSKYSRNVVSRRASSPKLNVMNSAIMSAYSDFTFEEATSDRSHWGRMVESAIGCHLLNSSAGELDVHYWREDNYEVDFVVRRGQRTVAIEVKSGSRPSSGPDHPGLVEFKKRFNPYRSIIVGSNAVSIHEFLSKRVLDWFD